MATVNTQGVIGTTSACAENTSHQETFASTIRNYLRVRGEYSRDDCVFSTCAELPPRARRIHQALLLRLGWWGTTSAHAENTGRINFGVECLGNYLRARGEYGTPLTKKPRRLELPPRTRRIQATGPRPKRKPGTTSAHAENTAVPLSTTGWCGNYLRARGEYTDDDTEYFFPVELPPRTRRIRCGFAHSLSSNGTTSAHAENTTINLNHHQTCRNYLRARGEYDLDRQIFDFNEELPPRTRRIQKRGNLRIGIRGTTSAHAENTHPR